MWNKSRFPHDGAVPLRLLTYSPAACFDSAGSSGIPKTCPRRWNPNAPSAKPSALRTSGTGATRPNRSRRSPQVRLERIWSALSPDPVRRSAKDSGTAPRNPTRMSCIPSTSTPGRLRVPSARRKSNQRQPGGREDFVNEHIPFLAICSLVARIVQLPPRTKARTGWPTYEEIDVLPIHPIPKSNPFAVVPPAGKNRSPNQILPVPPRRYQQLDAGRGRTIAIRN